MSDFWKFRPQPQERQLMIRPNTWSNLSPYNAPAVKTSQLLTSEMSRLIAFAPSLKENERAGYKAETFYINENSEIETYTVEV